MLEKVDALENLLYFIPVVVIAFEYVAISAAFAYAKYVVEYQRPIISLLGGIIKIGGNLPFDAVPNTVVTLHLLGLFLSLVFVICVLVFGWASKIEPLPLPPQDEQI